MKYIQSRANSGEQEQQGEGSLAQSLCDIRPVHDWTFLSLSLHGLLLLMMMMLCWVLAVAWPWPLPMSQSGGWQMLELTSQWSRLAIDGLSLADTANRNNDPKPSLQPLLAYFMMFRMLEWMLIGWELALRRYPPPVASRSETLQCYLRTVALPVSWLLFYTARDWLRNDCNHSVEKFR